MNNLFITGTDTDAGKTALSSLLLSHLNESGKSVLPMKPAQSGCNNSIPDLDYALSLSGIKVSSEIKDLMSPACYQPACSPHLAAEMENKSLTLQDLVKAYHQLTNYAEVLLVEGAGGILVPINRQETMLDLIYALKIPAIIAARPGLGTINHTLLTINALHQQNIPIIGFVFVHTHKGAGDFTETDNARTISEFGKTKWLGTIPYLPELDSENPPHYSSLPIVFKNIIEQITEKVFL